MGIVLIDQNADFSAVAVGQTGISTSLTTGLRALHELRQGAVRAVRNRAPYGAAATLGAAPTFETDHTEFTSAAQWVAGIRPLTGDLTIAMILQIKNGGATTDYPIGSINAPSVNGGVYFRNWNRRIQLETSTSTSPTSMAGIQVRSVFHDAAGDGSDDDTYELFVGVLEQGVGLDLYRPKSAAVATLAVAGSEYFWFDTDAGRYSALGGAGATQRLSLFAEWNRALSAAEVDTFYEEMREQFVDIGIDL